MKNRDAVRLGSIRTAKKAASCRANGQKGGRPKSTFRIVRQYTVEQTETGQTVATFPNRLAARAYLQAMQ